MCMTRLLVLNMSQYIALGTYYYEEKFKTVMINIHKTNNHPSPQIIKHKKNLLETGIKR